MVLPYTPPPSSSPKIDKYSGHSDIPAQQSYFYGVSNPSSHQVVIHQAIPPRKTPSPSGRRTPQNPIYYSPTNPVPSPFNASRPKPRPNFRKRVLEKIYSWIRKLAAWGKENPIKAGILTFTPVLALAGATRLLRGLGKLIGRGKKGADGIINQSRKNGLAARNSKSKGKRTYGWGLDAFVDFNGSKGGPVDGVLKILQMWVNHICRVTPSLIPRTAAILLELYFLELEKPH